VALWISAATLFTLNFCKRLRRWLSTVSGLMKIFSPISTELNPDANRPSTSFSLRVMTGRSLVSRFFKISLIPWLRTVSPSIAFLIPSMSSSADAFLRNYPFARTSNIRWILLHSLILLIAITTMSYWNCLIVAQASTPLRSGRLMSSSTTSTALFSKYPNI